MTVRAERKHTALGLESLVQRLGGTLAKPGGTADVVIDGGGSPLSTRVRQGESVVYSGSEWRRATLVQLLGSYLKTKPASLPSHRVLVVEDNPVNLRVMEGLLKRLNCESVSARDGAAALDRLSGADFDVVFMDIEMPVMNGIDATRAIRASGSKVPIVGVSANAASHEQQAGLDAGMDLYLSKPVRKKQLVEVLQNLDRR